MFNDDNQTVMRRINLSSDDSGEIRRYYLDNMEYRRVLYNDGIAYMRTLDPAKGSRYDAQHWQNALNQVYSGSYGHYEYYMEDIHIQEANDLHRVWKYKVCPMKRCISDDDPFALDDGHDPHFSVPNKLMHSGSNYHRRLRIVDGRTLLLYCNKATNYIVIDLYESIFDRLGEEVQFTSDDIGRIKFSMNLDDGEIYISLHICNQTVYKDFGTPVVAGIDMQRTNSLVLYDGREAKKYLIVDNDTKRRLDSMMVNIATLKKEKSKKAKMSKGYNRSSEKIRKLTKKMHGIYNNKCYELASYIAKTYTHIIVDEVHTQHTGGNSPNEMLTGDLCKEFQILLRKLCETTGCTYVVAKPNTTKTCSTCGHINDRLKVYDTHMVCANCGSTIDRDINAAINCYKQYRPK